MIELKMNVISTIFLFSFLIAILVVLVYIVNKWKKPTVWNYQDDLIIEKESQVDKTDEHLLKENSAVYNPFIAMHS